MTTIAVGRPIGQAAGPDKTTGRARYTGDITLPGMLYGAAARSTYAHARIVAINVQPALEMAGVQAVLTANDIPPTYVGRRLRDLPVLARDVVRFVGERVAIVAADTPEIAEAAALAIEIDYEELPAVLDVNAAIQPGAPILHPDLATYDGLPGTPPATPNTIVHRIIDRGDIEAGFKDADVIIQRRYTVPRMHQSYLEPHSSVAWVHEDGRAELWIANKTPYLARQQLSKGLGVDPSQLLFHLVPIGGDFGGKGSLMDLPCAYFLSQRTGHPVKMVMSYVEEFNAANPRHGAVMTLKTGIKRDGTIVAHQARALFDSGAYGAFKPSPTVDLGGSSKLGGPYHIPNCRIDSLMVYTNQVPSGHMRSPGLPQAAFAIESQIDVLARAIDMDPFEVRLKNVVHEGEATASGEKWQDIKATETLRLAAETAGWGTPKARHIGRGMAIGEHPSGGGEGWMEAGIELSGWRVRTATPDTGTGAHTIIRQVVAEVLEIDPDDVEITVHDTELFPFDGGVGGSRSTHVHGQAAARAAEQLKEALLVRASEALGKPIDELRWQAGVIRHGNETILPISLVEEPIRAIGKYDGTGAAPVTGFCTQVAEVEVDPETGQITVRNLVTAHDVGTIINPIAHQGQIEGGVIQALGYALMEELPISEGRVVTQSFGEYKIPTSADLPPLTTVFVNPSSPGPGPLESKSIGETPNVPLAPAIANAVEDAIGVRITSLPITAEKVFRALRDKQQHGHDH